MLAAPSGLERTKSKWTQDVSSSSTSSSIDLNSESYQCLLLPQISRSSLVLEPLYHFPPIDDPDAEAALWARSVEYNTDNTGVAVYNGICRKEGIIALRRVLKCLSQPILDLKYYGLQEADMKAICAALLVNQFVRTLNLDENYLSPASLLHLIPVIESNILLSSLSLKQCEIGYAGAKTLGDCFRLNVDLAEVNLSHNKLSDGMKFLANSFRMNKFIRKLDLSHNEFGVDAMKSLRKILEDNYYLTELDLSWNFIYKAKAMKDLMSGLAENMTLQSLNLSWNGIGDRETVVEIRNYLKTDGVFLTHLDLSNNRIAGKSVLILIAGLKKNDTLQSLSLAGNPLVPRDLELITDVMNMKKSHLKTLNFGDSWANKSFLPIRNIALKKGCTIIHGGIYGDYVIEGPDLKEMLLKRAKYVAMKQKKKKLRKDFGHFLLSLQPSEVKFAEFEAFVKKAKIKLDLDLLEMLMRTFLNMETKRLSITAMRDKYMELYPDTKLPEIKIKKRKEKNKKKA